MELTNDQLQAMARRFGLAMRVNSLKSLAIMFESVGYTIEDLSRELRKTDMFSTVTAEEIQACLDGRV